jgi:hypothetical protein
LQAATLDEATLYLGGKFNEKAEMLSGVTHIHSLSEFLKNAPKIKTGILPSDFNPANFVIPAEIPTVTSIRDVKVTEYGSNNAKRLTAEEFIGLMKTAQPMTGYEYLQHAIPWGYWCKGTFSTQEGTYRFQLGNGGVNHLFPPQGDGGIFKFVRETPTPAE